MDSKNSTKAREMAQGGEVFPWIHWVFFTTFGRSSLDATIYIALNSPCKLADISRYHLDTRKTGMTLLNLRDTKLIFNDFVFTHFYSTPRPVPEKRLYFGTGLQLVAACPFASHRYIRAASAGITFRTLCIRTYLSSSHVWAGCNLETYRSW